MYYCNNCSLKFDTPKKITETHSLHSPPYDYFYVCPLCNSSSFYEKKVTHCRCCGAKLKTEGTEYCSDTCRKKGEKYWLKQKLRNEAELESPINKIIRELNLYNKANNTNLSYGQYVAEKSFKKGKTRCNKIKRNI